MLVWSRDNFGCLVKNLSNDQLDKYASRHRKSFSMADNTNDRDSNQGGNEYNEEFNIHKIKTLREYL